MSMKTLLLLVLFTGLSIRFVSAQMITIEEAQAKAEANYPAIVRYDLIEQTKNFNMANANKAYLPQGTLSAQGTWQSDVTSIDLNMPGVEIPTIDQDQYKIAAELNQLIWDGGKISAQKKSIDAQAALENKQLDTEIYALRERVNNLYFGILLMKGQLNQHGILEKELQRNYDNVQVYIQNGVANEGDLSVVKVEQLKAAQQRIHLESTLEAYIRMLSVLNHLTSHQPAGTAAVQGPGTHH